MGTKHMKLNLQYISMQIPYWMGFSVLGTFTSVFLLSRDFTNGEIGMVLSLANLLAALVQPFLASFADRMTRVRLSQLAAGMAVLLVLFSGILLVLPKVFLVVAFIYVLMYACLVLLQPMTIAIGTFFISRGYFCRSRCGNRRTDRTIFADDHSVFIDWHFSRLRFDGAVHRHAKAWGPVFRVTFTGDAS